MDYEIKLLSEKTIQERECYELELMRDDSVITLYVDIKKKLPVQMIYTYDSKQIIRTYLEYKVVDGINYPIHTISTDIDNNMISEIKLKKVEFNIKIEGF